MSLALGLYMASRDDGITLLSTLVKFGALTAFLVVHVSVFVHDVVRNGGRDWGRHLTAPALWFLILAYVVVNADVAAQDLGFLWLGVGVLLLLFLVATGRRPSLTRRVRPFGGPMSMPDVRSLHPTPDQLGCAFGGREPLLTVPPGTVAELSSQVCAFPFLDPVTGPIAVEGAEVGDTVAVHFVEVMPARDWAVSGTFPHFGALTATHTTAMLHPALEERVRMYDVDVDAGGCRFRARRSGFSLELPLDPMHGTVGVAPAANEVLMSITPAAHGGNMDTPEMRAGTTAYFPVNVEGGMLSIGDGHPRQGEGEVCAARAPVSPRIESDEFLMTTGNARPLEDAYHLVSQVGLAPAGNVVDTSYTVLAKLPKWVLEERIAYGGLHDRLRAVGDEYLEAR